MNEAPEKRDWLIGATAYQVIRQSFGSGGAGYKECFRVKNLTDAESMCLLAHWTEKKDRDDLSHIRVVVAADSSDLFPPPYRAAEGTTITSYRNSKEPLLYIETKVESDEQGLQNLFTLRDVNFLDGSFDDEAFEVAGALVEEALELCSAGMHPAKDGLKERILKVLRGLQEHSIALPVRKFASFALAAADALSRQKGNMEASQLDSLIGNSLIHLDIFADDFWRTSASPSRISRRLGQNLLHAELANTQSADLDQDKLAEQCLTMKFRSADGQELSAAENEEWRRLCRVYCINPRREMREQIPYFIFEQLFSRDLKGLKLGERVREEIDQSDPSRIEEFDSQSFQGGVDRRDRDECQRFLEAQPEDDEFPALRDLLSKQTRRMVEKAAYPNPERFRNPLLKLAEIASTMRETIGGGVKDPHTLDMRLGRNADLANPSIGLLAFIFGPTLKSVIEASQLSTDGFELSADSRFLATNGPPSLLTREDEEEENDEDDGEGHTEQVEWHPVPIELALLNKTGEAVEVESALEWAPSDIDRMSLLWLMLCADDRPANNKKLGVPKELNFEAWVQETIARVTSLKSSEREEIKPERLRDHHVSQLLTLKSALEEKVHGTGFTAEALNDHFDSWSQLLREMKAAFVPDGKADPTLEVMLGFECMLGATDNSYMMLGTHPIKLRWLARYLKMSEELAVSALDGALPLNRQNRVMYLSWMSALSPQQQPAIHVSPSGKRLLAGIESGLTEEYHPPNASPETSHSEALSPQITSEIVGQVIAYLEAHPYKKDGISILLVSPVAPKFAADLVRSVRKGEWLNLPLVLHLSTPKHLWEMSSRYFEEVPSETRMAGVNGICPPLELRLHDLSSDKDPSELFADLEVDLSIIPQFFHGAPEMQENTEPTLEDGGAFDPLLDSPTFIYGGTNGGAMSVSQLPRNPDPTLASWSSIVVRQHRHKPVSPQQPENMDFVELRLNFQQASDLFTELHERSHWVITLEKYITREQIEQLDSGPEILTVRDRVGPGGMFTLIVSSNAGRKFIVRRLERKLATIVSKAGGDSRRASRELAQRIYDETREIAPRLALKAMGLSRVTEEILGLAVGRSFLEKHFPPSLENGLVAWISLDEHADWFGGSNSTRADLCRITLAETDNGLEVELLVLEAKLRQAGYDPHGVDQVTSTMQLFIDMMPEEEGNELIDARLWREMILSAIETANTSAVRFEGDVINDLEGQPHRIPVSMRNDFRDGNFRVRALEGIYCICTYSDSAEITIERPLEYDNLTICSASGIELLALIAGDDDGKEMIEPTPPIEKVDVPVSEPATSNQPDNGHQKDQLRQISSDGEQGRDKGATPDEGIQEQGALTSSRRLSRHELESRYQKILDTFEEFKISVRQPEDPAERFLEGPASVLYRIRPGHGVEPRKISEKADVLRLNLSLDEEQRICFSIDRGFITIDVPKSAQDRYFIMASELWENWHAGKNKLQVPIGEDRFGNLVSLNLSSNNSPHLLIGGTTGSGKSEALNTILAGLTKYYPPETLRLMLVDPKGTELEYLSDSPHLEGNIGWDDQDACSLLDRAVQEMHRRYDVFRAAKARSLPEFNEARLPEEQIPWWLIVLDEYADLTSDPDSKKEIEAHLRRLAQKARAAGIHLVIATQKPSAEVISTNLRSNLPAQLALKVKNATESRVVMDEAGAESLNGMGDAFLKCEGKLTRIQCAKV